VNRDPSAGPPPIGDSGTPEDRTADPPPEAVDPMPEPAAGPIPGRPLDPSPDEGAAPSETTTVTAGAPTWVATPRPSTTQGQAAPVARRPTRRRFHIRGVRGPVEVLIRALLVANVGIIAILLVGVLTSDRETPGHPVQGSPSASIDLMSMGLAHIPTSASCLLCHESGGSGGLKPIPAIGHPLEGWRRCVTCHTNETLGRKALGHQDIPEEECQNCHKLPPEGPAITQPHSRLQDQHCLDCHGTYAHLPTSMVGRNQDECWLCHKPTELPPPEYPHEPSTALGCRECHQSAQTGGLPIDHARRENTTCLLCHDIKATGPLPPLTPSLTPTLPPTPAVPPTQEPSS